jgi:hypothetical protein
MTLTAMQRVQAADRFVAEWAGKPMIWGETDCACGAAAMIELLTGKKPVKVWPKYNTPQGALKAIKRMKADNLADLVTRKLQVIKPGQSGKIGDIIGLQSVDDDWPALAVVLGQGAVLGISDGYWRRERPIYKTGLLWGVR